MFSLHPSESKASKGNQHMHSANRTQGKFESSMPHRKRSFKNNIGSIYRGSSPLHNLNAQCMQ